MKTSSIFGLILSCLLSISSFGQLTIGYTEYAETLGDVLGSDGYAADACSEAVAISSFPMSLEVSAGACDCLSLTEGNPFAQLSGGIFITNPPANTFPTKGYLGHSIPFGFKTEVSIENFFNDNTVEFNYTHSYGGTNFSLIDDSFQTPQNGITSLSFSGEENLILPVGQYHMDLSTTLFGSVCGEDILAEALFDDPVILLPSQFYSDNGITVPSSITISSVTFDVETVCAENMYLENVELDSYHYGTSGLLHFDAEVINGANVTASASSSINFGPGFFVDSSSNFSTIPYTGCTP